jgi:Tfp pilus assembly PilM family ATPase
MFWIGLHLEGAVARWAKIRRQKKDFSIELLRSCHFEENTQLSFPQCCLEEIPYKIISGLETSEVLLRDIQLKIQDKKKILKSLPFQIEAQLPCQPEEAVVAIQIFPGDVPKSSKISFYATKASSLVGHLDKLKEKGVEPDQTSCVPAALWRFAKTFFPEVSEGLVLHIGAKTSSAISLSDQKPIAAHSFSLGSEPFLAAVQEAKQDPLTVDLCSISEEETPTLYQVASQAEKELDRLFAFLQKKNKEPWKNVILTGQFCSIPALKEFIKSRIPSSILLHECEAIDSYDVATLESYAIPIGLALDASVSDGKSTEFRQKTFASSSFQKRSLKLLLSFCLACFVLTSATLLTSSIYLSQKKKHLVETLQSSFSLQNKRINTIEDLDYEISLLESSLRKNKTPYSLNLPLPNVSELLAWLSAHPILSTVSSSNDLEVDIKSVKYQLVKHPKLSSPSAPYLAKVDLEIDIPSSQIAKEFKESLQKETSLADPKKEVSWQSKGSTYFISFFLKNSPGARS